MIEPQGERVSALVLFEQSADMSVVASVSATQLAGNATKERFKGPPWKQTTEKWGNSL